VQPLHLDVEQGVRIHNDPGALLDEAGQVAFVVGFDGLPVPLKVEVAGQRLEALELVFQIRYPSVTDVPSDEGAQFRITQRDPAPRRHSVGHVEEFLRRHPVEVMEHRSLQKLGMEGGDPVDRVAPHARKVRHAYVFVSDLVDQRNRRAADRRWDSASEHVEEATINLAMIPGGGATAWQTTAAAIAERFGKQRDW
jgi:hypothetical protein